MTNVRETISEWFYLYSNDVYNFLVYYTCTTDVEDLVQEVFIKAGRGLHSYKNQASPKTWLFTIARNTAIDEARKKRQRLAKTVQHSMSAFGSSKQALIRSISF